MKNLYEIEDLLNREQTELNRIAKRWRFKWDCGNTTDFDVDECKEDEIDQIDRSLDVIEGVCMTFGYNTTKDKNGQWHCAEYAERQN